MKDNKFSFLRKNPTYFQPSPEPAPAIPSPVRPLSPYPALSDVDLGRRSRGALQQSFSPRTSVAVLPASLSRRKTHMHSLSPRQTSSCPDHCRSSLKASLAAKLPRINQLCLARSTLPWTSSAQPAPLVKLVSA